VSQQRLRAITANLTYLWDIGAYGSLKFAGSYTSNLEHTQQIYPGDPEIDLLREPFYSSDPKNKANASVTWDIDNWAVTGYVNRMGSTPNYRSQIANTYENGTIGPWILYNVGVNYQALDNLEFSFLVNNITDKIPEDHSRPGTSGAPYDSFQYNPYGRAMYLEMRYKFGTE
jgi:outer membrane receptor protein involved in Fe transport